jgi:hypothetical protein
MSGAFDCASEGTTLELTVTGNAFGPYPGTFTQDVTARVWHGVVESFEAQFEITSGDTTVEGQATLRPGSPADGQCGMPDPDEDGIVFSAGGAGSGHEDLHLDYTATITSPAGTANDQGVAAAGLLLYCWSGPADVSMTNCDPASSILRFIGADVPEVPRVAEGQEGSASTASEPTEEYPIATSISNPAGGVVTIAEYPSPGDVSGYQFLGGRIELHAEFEGTVEEPIEITFIVHSSLLFDEDGAALEPDEVTVLRDGEPATDCTGDGPIAVPDPCVYSRTLDAAGNLTLRVLTVHASLWSVVVLPPVDEWVFTGFERPVDNDGVLNVLKAGQTVPLKWRLTDTVGAPILGLTEVSIKVSPLACPAGTPSDVLEEPASGTSGLKDLGNGYYQYNWKTKPAYAKSCRTLTLELGDGPSEHTALFQFNK